MGDKLTAFVGGDDVPADGRWVVHLAMHPQINLYNTMRKRFVHLDSNELRCTEDIPWGEDALLTLEFYDEHTEGRYGIRACDGRYLDASGSLKASPSASCQFLIGFHDDQISLCSDDGSAFTNGSSRDQTFGVVWTWLTISPPSPPISPASFPSRVPVRRRRQRHAQDQQGQDHARRALLHAGL